MLELLLACAAPPADTARELAPLDRAALERHLPPILAGGARTPGSAAEAAAMDHAEQTLEAMGLEPRREAYSWEAWSPGPTSILAGGEELEAWAWSPAPGDTVSGVLSAEAGEGGILLTSSDRLSRAEAFVEARSRGCAGLIHVTEDVDADGVELVEVGHTLDGSTMPAAAVPRSTGEKLRALEGQTVELRTGGTVEERSSENLFAVLPGSGPGAVMVVAHLDSWHLSESAFDNGLGVAALLAMAEHAPVSRRSIWFLLTTGEEQGLRGAQAWAAAHDEEVRAELRLVVTLDVLWSAKGRFWLMADQPEHLEAMLAAAEAEGLEAREGGAPSPASDHFPFQVRGVPAVWPTRQGDPHYHTLRDLAEYLDLDEAASAMRVAWAAAELEAQ